MADDRWRPLTWPNDPGFMEVVDRYTPATRKAMLDLADIEPSEGDLFLTRVFTIAYALVIEIGHPDEPWQAVQREALEVIIQGLSDALGEIGNLNAPTREAIAIQAKIAQAIASGETIDEPQNWEDSTGTNKLQTAGRPTDPKEFQAWIQSPNGRFETMGGEQYVQDAIIQANALCRWTTAALKSTPKRQRGHPHEVVVRKAVRRLRTRWIQDTKRPAALRGRFSRFIEAVLRPAVHGYWTPEKKFESAIKDVIKAARLRERAKNSRR